MFIFANVAKKLAITIYPIQISYQASSSFFIIHVIDLWSIESHYQEVVMLQYFFEIVHSILISAFESYVSKNLWTHTIGSPREADVMNKKRNSSAVAKGQCTVKLNRNFSCSVWIKDMDKRTTTIKFKPTYCISLNNSPALYNSLPWIIPQSKKHP